MSAPPELREEKDVTEGMMGQGAGEVDEGGVSEEMGWSKFGWKEAVRGVGYRVSTASVSLFFPKCEVM